MQTEFGQLASGLHEVRIISEGWNLTVPQTLFSSVNFLDGFVRGLDVNPHLEYLTLEQAAGLLDALESEFTRFGFRPHPEQQTSGKDLRERAEEIYRDSTYHAEPYRARRANVMCSMVLKKSVLKDSYLGKTAKLDADRFLLTLGVRILKEGDRF